MASLNIMVKKVAGLEGTKDITDWENGFVKSLIESTKNGENTTRLTERQIDVLQQLYDKHFG